MEPGSSPGRKIAPAQLVNDQRAISAEQRRVIEQINGSEQVRQLKATVSSISGGFGETVIQPKLRVALDKSDKKSAARWQVYLEQLNELYRLGSAERNALNFGRSEDQHYVYFEAQEPEHPNHSMSADLLSRIIASGNETTLYAGSDTNEAVVNDRDRHEAGHDSHNRVLLRDHSNTIELAHELIHISHFNENPHWNEAHRKAAYEWRDPHAGDTVREPDGREEARTVGLGQYDLDRRSGGYMGTTENDLRYIMGIRKRANYADSSFAPETAVGAHYVEQNHARWARFDEAVAEREEAHPAAAAGRRAPRVVARGGGAAASSAAGTRAQQPSFRERLAAHQKAQAEKAAKEKDEHE